MLREIAQIILSIHMSQLGSQAMPQARQEQLSGFIQEKSDQADVDPFLVVAIITHESKWRERVISDDRMDYGLMQVRAMYYGAPANALLYGENNIRAGVYVMKKSIDFCRGYLKREPTTQEWLSVYQGSVPSCKPTALTKIVEDYQFCLEDVIILEQKKDCREIYWGKIGAWNNYSD
jgi:hypothetical protein